MRLATDTTTYRCDGCGHRYSSATYRQQSYMFWVEKRPVLHHLAACSEACMERAVAGMGAKNLGHWQELCGRR